jgi:AmmeMemoRadiSam system protein B
VRRRSRSRPPSVAGLFYPADPIELASLVDRELAAAASPSEASPPKAIVAPHAGYLYSGPIAASAYRRLVPRRGEIHRVVVLGPAHRTAVAGMAVPQASAFTTPLGSIPIDDELRSRALTHVRVTASDAAHAGEHSIEVQLPFLQRVLGRERWALLPIVVGRADTAAVADVLDDLWGGPETLVVVSTDLSHYEPYELAQHHDAATTAAIVTRDASHVDTSDACGAHPMRGLIEVARRRDLAIDLVDLRNSGDTAGDRDRVVGYGSFVVGSV